MNTDGRVTLLLNADYRPFSLVPLSKVTWQFALKAVYLDRVNVLEYYEGWEVRSPSATFIVPSVIMLKNYITRPDYVPLSKHYVFLRDEYTCSYCGREYYENRSRLTVDHIVPRSKGGKSDWYNLTTACSDCNSRKQNMVWKPLNKPHMPTYFELQKKRKKFPIVVPDSRWKLYLEWPEDLVVVRSPPNVRRR